MPEKGEELYKILKADPNYEGVGSDYNKFKEFFSDEKNYTNLYNTLKADPNYEGIGKDANAFSEFFGLKKKEQTMPFDGQKFGGKKEEPLLPLTSSTVSPSASKPPKSTIPSASIGVKESEIGFKPDLTIPWDKAPAGSEIIKADKNADYLRVKTAKSPENKPFVDFKTERVFESLPSVTKSVINKDNELKLDFLNFVKDNPESAAKLQAWQGDNTATGQGVKYEVLQGFYNNVLGKYVPHLEELDKAGVGSQLQKAQSFYGDFNKSIDDLKKAQVKLQFYQNNFIESKGYGDIVAQGKQLNNKLKGFNIDAWQADTERLLADIEIKKAETEKYIVDGSVPREYQDEYAQAYGQYESAVNIYNEHNNIPELQDYNNNIQSLKNLDAESAGLLREFEGNSDYKKAKEDYEVALQRFESMKPQAEEFKQQQPLFNDYIQTAKKVSNLVDKIELSNKAFPAIISREETRERVTNLYNNGYMNESTLRNFAGIAESIPKAVNSIGAGIGSTLSALTFGQAGEYNVYDKMADYYDGLNKYNSTVLPTMKSYKELKDGSTKWDFAAIGFQGFQQIGNMAIFATLGRYGKAPMVVTGYMMSRKDRENEAKEAGLTGLSKEAYVSTLSSLEGLSELVMPDSQIFTKEIKQMLLKDAVLAQTKGINWFRKQVFKRIAENTGKEVTEEFIVKIGELMQKVSSNYSNGNVFDVSSYKDVNSWIETAAITAPLTILASSASEIKTPKIELEQARFQAAKNLTKSREVLDDLVSTGNMTTQKADDEYKKIVNYAAIQSVMPVDISPAKAVEVAPLIIENKKLEIVKESGIDEVFKKQISEKIKENIAKAEEILSRPEEAQIEEVQMPEDIASLKDDETITVSVNSMDEVPEQFRDRVRGRTITGTAQKSFLGLFGYGKKTDISKPIYSYTLTGAEAKQTWLEQNESGISQEAAPKGDTGVEVTEPVIEEGKEQVEIEETPTKEEITPEQIETGRQEVSAVKEGKIETANPIRLFKGLFGKRNLDGTHKSAHPNAKGVFSAVDEKVAERYKGEDGMGTFDIPAGTTMEVIRLAVRNVPMSKFREQETEAINASDAQIVKLITTDAKGAEEQYVIKDPALIEKMQKPEDVTKENVGYRQGDLVKKAENLWKMSSTDRSTGHFGTGYYFFGKKEDAEGYEENKRGVNKINLDNYNLAKGTKELHNLLKRVNEISSKTQETDIKNAVKGVMEYLGLFPEKPKMSENPTDAEFDALREYDKKNDQLVAPIAAAIQKQIPNKDNVNTLGENADSLSTVLMKSLGYEGIDSRGTELDNSRYGSVIYDIKPEDVKQTKEQEDAVQKQTAGQVPVQPETEVSEGVDGGKPKAEPKEATEESKEEVAKKAGISPKNFKDLYNVNRKLFGLDRVKSLASAVAMDRMIGAMAKRAGTTKAEMYGRLKFEKTSEKELPQGVKMQVDAWHGSPYQFDKFTTEKIGTGEGNQAFGWGLYFTDLESIARSYAENLTPVLYSYDGNLLSKDAVEYLNLADWANELDDFNQETIKAIAKKAIDKIKKEYIPDFKDIQKTSPSEKQRQVEMPEQIKIAKNVIKELQGIIASKEIKQEKNKKLYKVSLQKGKTPDQYTWLEWDKPVPRSIVKNFIEDLNKDSDFKKNYGNSYLVELENGEYDNLTGKYFYNGLAKSALQKLGKYSNKDVSLALLNVGIDGIKYPAESISRGATSETARAFNYVVFDENAVSIEEVIKFQKDANKARGAVMVTLDGEAVIYALTDPNVSTPLHELAHVFEHYLTEGEKQTIIKNAGTKGWTIETSEYFARGFEKYLAEGKSPVPALDKLFAKFKEWLTEIYNGIKGSDIDIKLNKPMRDIYASMLGEKIEGAKFPDNISKIAKELNLSPQQIQNTYKKYDGSKKIEDITLEDYNKARAEGNKIKLDNSKKAFEALLKEEIAKDKVSPTAQKELAKVKENVDDKALKAASKMMENIDEIREKLLDAGVIKSINCKWG